MLSYIILCYIILCYVMLSYIGPGERHSDPGAPDGGRRQHPNLVSLLIK